MLIETVELNLANTGLGLLTEEKLMVLFANTQAHRLIAGTNHTLSDIVDADNQLLYPGYIWLNLTVPDKQTINQFKAWESVDLGVKVHRFGSTMLESEYVIGSRGSINENSFNQNCWPRMKALSVFIRSDDTPSAPATSQLAELPTCKQVPHGIQCMKKLHNLEEQPSHIANINLQQQFEYPLFLGRDVAADKNLMFSEYITIMNVTEQQLICANLPESILPEKLIPHFHLNNREVVFNGHAAFGNNLLVDVQLSFTVSKTPTLTEESAILGVMHTSGRIYDSNTNKLITRLSSTKHLRVPFKRLKEFQETIKIWLKLKGNNYEK